jgi:hypothetical protein
LLFLAAVQLLRSARLLMMLTMQSFLLPNATLTVEPKARKPGMSYLLGCKHPDQTPCCNRSGPMRTIHIYPIGVSALKGLFLWYHCFWHTPRC